MISCEFCDEKFKYAGAKKNYQNHYERFHQSPTMMDDGTIQINAIHHICLVLKGDDTWEQQLKKEIKKKDESAITAIKQIQAFEHNHNIELKYYKENTIEYVNLEVPLANKVRSFFHA